MTKRTIGEFMALLRKAAGYTQQEVAEKLNISNRTLSSWETDRTVPDVLMLPAIAELYGVTVDELLRGERNQSGDAAQVQLSEKSQRAVRKSRYGKFGVKCSLYTALAFLCGMVILLAGIMLLFAGTPFWASLILWIAGGIGSGVFIIMIFYELSNIKISEGIVTDEDFTEENKPLALNLKRKVASYLALQSIPFLIGMVLFSATWVDYGNKTLIFDLDRSLADACSIFIGVYTCIGGGFLLAALLYANLHFEKLASEKQLATHNANLKLAAKVFGFGAVPVVITFILAVVFWCVTISTYKELYKHYETDSEDFTTHMQTLTVEKGDYFNTVFDMEPGKYPLNFPKNNDDERIDADNGFDVGYGFYCKQNPYSYIYLGRHIYSISVCTLYKENYDEEILFQAYFSMHLDENGDRIETTIVNAAYYNEKPYDRTVAGVVSTKECGISHCADNTGHYTAFTTFKIDDYRVPFLGLFIATAIVTIPTCITIYTVKHKKQNYSF